MSGCEIHPLMLPEKLWSRLHIDHVHFPYSAYTPVLCVQVHFCTPRTFLNSVCKDTTDLLHIRHLGVQRMKQLARSVVYWPRIEQYIERISRQCTACAEFQNQHAKPVIHPWVLPEKPWSRLHVDHGISFLGHDRLVLVDAYSKYSCIHMTGSTSTEAQSCWNRIYPLWVSSQIGHG